MPSHQANIISPMWGSTLWPDILSFILNHVGSLQDLSIPGDDPTISNPFNLEDSTSPLHQALAFNNKRKIYQLTGPSLHTSSRHPWIQRVPWARSRSCLHAPLRRWHQAWQRLREIRSLGRCSECATLGQISWTRLGPVARSSIYCGRGPVQD